MNYEQFSDCKSDELVITKVSANKNGAGKSAFINKTGHKYFCLDKSCKVASIVKPGNTDGKIKEYERFNMEVTVTPQEEAKANELDAKFLKNLFENRVDFFGASKSKAISSVEAIKPMYKYMTREGTDKPDGSKYANTFRLKVDGWYDYCADVHVVEKVKDGGEKVKYVRDCEWKNRIVGKDSAPLDNNTTFYLILGENELGKPKYTDKVPLKDSSDNFVLDDKGNKVWRYVGPQDVTYNAEVTVLWYIQKLYVTESTGPTMVAYKVYIKPAPKVSSNKSSIESVQLSADDVLLAMSVPTSVVASEPVQQPVQEIEEVATVTKVDPQVVTGKKRKITSSSVSEM